MASVRLNASNTLIGMELSYVISALHDYFIELEEPHVFRHRSVRIQFHQFSQIAIYRKMDLDSPIYDTLNLLTATSFNYVFMYII